MSWSRRLAALLPRTVAEDSGGTEPDARFTFANERTFLAWSRTALALVVAGLAIVQLLPPFPGVPVGRPLLGLPSFGALGRDAVGDSVHPVDRLQVGARWRAMLEDGVPLDLEAARRAFRPVADALGVSIEEAAAGAYDLINVSMATGVRDITVRRGLDPRDFPVVVAGGAGPLHAAAIAAELEVALLLVPRESSIFCAAGMLMCDFQHDAVRALKAPLAELDPAEVGRTLEELAAEGRETLHGEGVGDAAISFTASLDLRYAGQWHELEVALPWEPGEAPDLSAMTARFDAEHDRTFGYSSPGDTIECLALRLSARGATEKPDLGEMDEMSSGAPAPVSRRPTWSARGRAMVDTPVYDGHGLGAGFEVSGPAIVELATTTIVVPEGFDLLVDRRGSFVLAAGERGRKLAEDLLGRLHSVG